MQTLQLIPAVHQQQPIVKAIFAYDKEIIGLVKSQKGARWSQTMKTWYFPKDEFQLDTFFQALKEKTFVDYSRLKSNSSTTPVKKIIREKVAFDLELPEGYKEQLILKRYSHNTIKTYSSCFLKFMMFFKDKKLESLSENEIKTFLLYLVQQKKVSPSTQNGITPHLLFYPNNTSV
jgi:integrase/recombinase XerD